LDGKEFVLAVVGGGAVLGAPLYYQSAAAAAAAAAAGDSGGSAQAGGNTRRRAERGEYHSTVCVRAGTCLALRFADFLACTCGAAARSERMHAVRWGLIRWS
jgi:hypothetical protein